ncbi:major pollen allergen Ole e 10 [Capsicum galapagoense]
MTKAILTLFFLLLSLSAGILTLADEQKTWCVAKPSSEDIVLNQNLEFACKSNFGCTIFGEGGPCFLPNNLMNHASIAMNLYYQANGRKPYDCSFGNSGLVVLTDPSYGSCIYA